MKKHGQNKILDLELSSLIGEFRDSLHSSSYSIRDLAFLDGFSAGYGLMHEHYNKDFSLFKASKPNGEYGYFVNTHNAYLISKLISIFKFKNFLDLGSGAGILLKYLSGKNNTTKFVGYENEDLLVEESRSLFKNSDNCCVFKKDIIQLSPSDLVGFDVIYLWEPIKDGTKAKIFAENLCEVLQKNQIVLYQSSGEIGHVFKEKLKLVYPKDRFGFSGFFIYQKIK